VKDIQFKHLQLLYSIHVHYTVAIQMFNTIRGDAPEYLRSTFTFCVWYTCKTVTFIV